ncbi:hypothetical protein FQN57_003134 [Myotisia sp. PD_48]|nr:hypothetical protein FQN57_003134 [Myotisia sp. PD_48]
MPKDKERTINPALAQRKLEKQKALKKGKAEIQARRNEKLARRNPQRIQRQIDDFKSLEETGQTLKPQQKQALEELERDLRAINKAREALGDKAPTFGTRRDDSQRGDKGGALGKRRREGEDGRPSRQWRQQEPSSGSETDESVRRIPMPRDTPPPIPRRHQQQRWRQGPRPEGTGANAVGERTMHTLPAKPHIPEAKAVYEAAPVIRNLQKEAISKFVPATVRMKQAAVKGTGQLLEPEELDKLEKAGYTRKPEAGSPAPPTKAPASSTSLEEEEKRFERELQAVQIEDVPHE